MGEAGRGFAVVADAVKNLAGQAKETASEAETSIREIKEAGTSVLNITQQSNKETIEGVSIIQAAIEGANQIRDAVKNVAKIMEELNSQVQQGMAAAREVVKLVDEVSSVAQESASAAEEASAGVEEQSAAAEEMATISKRIMDETAQAESRLNGILAEAEKLREIIESLSR